MGSYVLGFEEIDQTQVAVVGGKGAQLGELSRIEGVRVPAGFCVTTDAFRRITEDAPSLDDRLSRLSSLNLNDREASRTRSAEIRGTLVRIVVPQAAGVLFTADPVTSNRKVVSVEASFGLGEALVSGQVNADVYKVRDGDIVAKAVATKQRAIHASPDRGTQEQPIEPARQEQPALTDAQVVQLAQLGRRIEAHFGCPQEIEWCLADDGFQIVQGRPITTLFPIPDVGDGGNHVYVSVGHQQMMTDAMKPLGLSVWQLTALRPMYQAGGRPFVDVTEGLGSPPSPAGPLRVLGEGDPPIRDALEAIPEDGEFTPSPPDTGSS